MKEKLALLLILAIPSSLFAQGKFKIELSSPSHINDSLSLSPFPWAKELKGLYCVNLDTNQNIIDIGEKNGIEKSVYQIAVQEKNVLRGEFDYPIPFTFQFIDPKEMRFSISSKFFLDSGSYKIELPKVLHRCNINLNSPVNNEYARFKKLFADLYVRQEENYFDSLTNPAEKENRVGSYIRKNPDSYVALWEIVDDYINQDYYPVYLENLRLFSANMKTTKLFTTFESILKHDSSANKGNRFELQRSVVSGSLFPEINFDDHNTLTREDFKKSKLTLIDCWGTECGPCIKAIPEIVALYNEYYDQGVNFISVALDSDPKKNERAREILNKNNVKWKNYLDIKKDFNNKVGIVSIPLLFLVDHNGRIVERVNSADIGFIKKTIDDYLRNGKSE